MLLRLARDASAPAVAFRIVRVQPRPPAMSPERALLAFAVSVFVFHQLPSFAGDRAGAAIDLLTPFAVVGSSAAVLAGLGARRAAVVAALVAGTLYVDGHGIHLAANSINNESGGAGAADVVFFWDERFSHLEAVLGWFGLVGTFCLAESAARRPAAAAGSPRAVLAATAVLLGWTFFTSTVEGKTWWLELAATALFAAWALRSRRTTEGRRPILLACAAAFVLGAMLIGAWALWHGSVPEFSESGLI